MLIRRMLKGLILAILGWWLSGCQQALPVATVRPERRSLTSSFTEQAEMRLARTFLVTMPATGTIARIDLEPGDPVRKGGRLVAFDRLPQEQLVVESVGQVRELEAQLALNEHAGVEHAEGAAVRAQEEAALRSVEAERTLVAETRTRLLQAEADLRRSETLHAQGFVTQKELEDVRLAANLARSATQRAERQLRVAQANLRAAGERSRATPETLENKALRQQVLRSQLAQAQSRLSRVRHEATRAVIPSPVDGVVLERYQQGPGPLVAGERLLLLGRRSDLEAVCEVLTQDAVSVRPGTPVSMTATSGGVVIKGKVKRIEPQAFTKLSALGVEQKRVRVIIGLEVIPPEVGSGYRLEACFQVARKESVLTVPRFSVLQAPDRTFYVYLVAEGRLKVQPVKVGLQEDVFVEIVDGLRDTDSVVAAPDVTYKEGMAVTSSSRPPRR